MSTGARSLCPLSGALTGNCAVRSALWVRSMWRVRFRTLVARSVGSGVRCYAARAKKKEAVMAAKTMPEEEAFYVLRKGGMVAIYKTLAECQAQVSPSVGDPAVGVYKGYSLQKEAIEYLTSRGITNPLYCIDAADWKDDLLGPLAACQFQQPDTHSFPTQAFKDTSMLKRSQKVLQVDDVLEPFGSSSDVIKVPSKHPKLAIELDEHTAHSTGMSCKQPIQASLSCIVEFDGACKGNPGRAGAGVVIRKEDGTVISRLREGLGEVTNNVAEYRAVILGMKFALKRGFQKILVQGDSKLVCMQIEEHWKTKDSKMIELVKEAKALKEKFLSFKICHVLRGFNSDADQQANLAAALQCGEVQEDYCDVR